MINKTLGGRMGMHPVIVIVTLLAASIVQSQAQTYTLATGDTSLQINLGGPNPGLSNWTIGGVNQLEQEWFYYSVGGGAVNSIDTIAPWSTPTLGGGSTPLLTETYTANSDLSVTTTYTLQSLSSAVAQLGTAIAIQNLSGSTNTFHFYQYSHFALGGVAGGQEIQVYPAGSSTLYQYPASGGYFEETVDTGLGTTVTESAAIYNGAQLGLENGNPPPNFTDPSGVIGPGDVNFAYEFTATLAPNASITLSTIQSVPEPSPLALIFSGILAFATFYGRKLVCFKKYIKVLPFNFLF